MMLFMANKVLEILALGLAVVCRIPASSAENFSGISNRIIR